MKNQSALLTLALFTSIMSANASAQTETNTKIIEEKVFRPTTNELFQNLFQVSAQSPSFMTDFTTPEGIKLYDHDRPGVFYLRNGEGTAATISGFANGLWNVLAYPKDGHPTAGLAQYSAWRNIELTDDADGFPTFQTSDDTALDFSYEQQVIDKETCDRATANGPIPVQFRGTIVFNGTYNTAFYGKIKALPARHYAYSNGVYSDNPESYAYKGFWGIGDEISRLTEVITLDRKLCEDSNGLKLKVGASGIQKIAIKEIRFEVVSPF